MSRHRWRIPCLAALACTAVACLLADASARTTPGPAVQVFQTDASRSQFMKRMPDLRFSSARARGRVIRVKDQFRYQRMRALGAAMTDSSAWLLYEKLDAHTRARVMEDLFGQSGIHLGFLRIPMGASDFTVHGRPYSYDDRPAGQTDPHLRHFSIRHDLAYIIPAIREALTVNPGIWLLANPWSPPGWMKANDAMNNRQGSGSLLRSSYGPLARYFVKFLRAYRDQNVPISAVTPENEPDTWTRYPGLELHEPQEADLIRHHLRPALRQAGLGTRIYGNDASWDRGAYTSAEIGDAGGLGGIAWHCYAGSPGLMDHFHHRDPHLDQIVDECSPELRPFSTSEFLIASLRNWATTVTVWNIALDPRGGPVQPPNNGCPGCNGVVVVHPRTHTATFGLKAFQLEQVGHFVQPGAQRISSTHFIRYDANLPHIISPGVDDVAFRNPDGSTVLVAFNSASTARHFAVQYHGKSFSYTIPSRATTTFMWR